jgi:hypothetical protein
MLLLVGLLTACSLVRNTPEVQPSPFANQNLIQELQNLGLGKYLDTPFNPGHTSELAWEVYRYPAEYLRCIEGGEYFILAKKGTKPDHTVIWLEGGGACWQDRDDCNKEAILESWAQTWFGESGMAAERSENPVKNWNFIYVPYCDGSLHLGDSEVDYDEDGKIDHWHWGLKSTSAALQLAKALFPQTQGILIAGCSAGGGGTLGVAPMARLQFPEASLYVLNISGAALINPERPEILGTLKETWNIGQLIPSDCLRCSRQITYMYSWLLERDSKLRIGMFSAYQDAVSSSGWGMTPESFQALIMSTTDTIHAEYPKTFQRFFIKGDTHCLDDYSYEVNGVSFWEWVDYLVNGNPRWSDILE